MPEHSAPSSSVVAIARGHIALQLALTGVHIEEVVDARDAEEVLDRYLESGARDREQEVQVLVVQEDLRDQFSSLMRDRLAAHRRLPLIVYCPEFDKEDSEVDAYLAAVLRPAVGYEIRLE